MGAGASFTLGRLAEVLNAALEGEAERVVTGVAPLGTATASQLAYVADRRQLAAARASHAGAFLAPTDVTGLPAPTLRCADSRRALAAVLTLFHPPAVPVPGVDRTARVDAGARVDATASIGPFAVIEAGASIGPRVRIDAHVYVGAGAEIGEGSALFPHVVVNERCRLGRRVVVHPGAVIGADGFGFIPDPVAHLKIPQVGTVVVGDDVEIGANATIDRATLGATSIGRGTKIDNLVHIAHNVEIGEGALIAAQVGIAGSSRLGPGVILGGQAGVADHVTIGAGAVMGAQSGTTKDIGPGERVALSWARPLLQATRIWHAEERLPDLLRTVKRLEARVEALETRMTQAGGSRG
jgi:UDP-3-O-[3-hydroxymyristoyl] glucosamine N-acyltransferase